MTISAKSAHFLIENTGHYWPYVHEVAINFTFNFSDNNTKVEKEMRQEDWDYILAMDLETIMELYNTLESYVSTFDLNLISDKQKGDLQNDK